MIHLSLYVSPKVVKENAAAANCSQLDLMTLEAFSKLNEMKNDSLPTPALRRAKNFLFNEQ